MQLGQGYSDMGMVTMSIQAPSRREQCRDWLVGKLSNGPVHSSEIRAEATERGISTGTLYRVANEIGVRSTRDATWAPGSVWELVP